jgi:hypothetical protein
MRTRLLGLLAPICIMLSSAVQAEPATVVAALFRTVETRVDAVLLAANLADIDPALVPHINQCGYDALNGRPEPAAVLSPAPAETASAALDADHPDGLSTPDSEPLAEAGANELPASSTTVQSAEANAVLGSAPNPAMPSGPDELFGSEGEKSGVAEARSDPLPALEVTGSLSGSGVNPPETEDAKQDSDIILP